MTRMAMFVAAALVIGAPAAAAERLSDKEVKALVERIEDARDRFEDALDSNLKRSVLRGPDGEVSVEAFLDDFQDSVDRLEERLAPNYAASTEAAALLRQGSRIDAYFRQQPAGTRGESEWARLAVDLQALALAYGAHFPLPEGATVRRIGDRELAGAVDQIARAADRLKRSLDNDLKKDTAVDKAARTAIVGEANLLAREARTLRSRVKDGKPSSAEAEAVLRRAATLRAFIESHQVPASASAWASLAPRVQILADAYGAPAATTTRR